MSFTETTLVVRGDIDSTAANCLATSVANAATDGKCNDAATIINVLSVISDIILNEYFSRIYAHAITIRF